jgi:NAD(P)-dependent dehydrogenase (short-subunit alcohol dehydrogenase family)
MEKQDRVSFDFSGEVAVVTGAASGIGKEVARQLVAAGATVYVNDLDPARVGAVAAELGDNAIAAAGDVTVLSTATSIVEAAKAKFGKLDILVNSAGIADEMVPTLEQDLDRWQRVVDVSLRGSYLMSREAGRLMTAARSGKIINFASIAGVVGLPGRNAYSAAKAGIVMMTKTMAAEWGGLGVRVNAIAPGYIETPMVDDLMSRGRITDEMVHSRTPLRRFGEPSEIAKPVLFLCSSAASYVTGACLSVDGGWAAFGGIALPVAE